MIMTIHQLYHRDDPSSSREAIERHDGNGRRATNKKLVLAAVEAKPEQTSREYSEAMYLDRHEVRRRLTDLLNEGLVRQGEARKCKFGRGKALTWLPAGEPEETQTEMF
jgi:transcription initiation factor IIE alpha subunit